MSLWKTGMQVFLQVRWRDQDPCFCCCLSSLRFCLASSVNPGPIPWLDWEVGGIRMVDICWGSWRGPLSIFKSSSQDWMENVSNGKPEYASLVDSTLGLNFLLNLKSMQYITEEDNILRLLSIINLDHIRYFSCHYHIITIRRFYSFFRTQFSSSCSNTKNEIQRRPGNRNLFSNHSLE